MQRVLVGSTHTLVAQPTGIEPAGPEAGKPGKCGQRAGQRLLLYSGLSFMIVC